MMFHPPKGMIATITATLTGRPTTTMGIATLSTRPPVAMYMNPTTLPNKEFCEHDSFTTCCMFAELFVL